MTDALLLAVIDASILAFLLAALVLAHVLENLLTARCLTPDCPRCGAATAKASAMRAAKRLGWL